MVTVDTVMTMVNRHLTKLLNVAEAALPREQFKGFRRIALDEFGRNGLEGDLRRLEHSDRQGSAGGPGTERAGIHHALKGGDHA